jgi:lipopolysaccharide export system permease protein
MGLLTRYVISELLKVFLVALAGMSTLMLLVFLIYEAMRQGLGANAALQLIPFMMPHALCFAIPGTILFSVCSVFGRMASANEVVAIKSLGISPQAIIFPILILSFILSLVTVWLNDVAFSWGREKAYQVVLNHVTQTIYRRLETQGNYSNANISISVIGVEGDYLLRPKVEVKNKLGGPTKTIKAERAKLKSDTTQGVLTVIAERGSYQDDKVSFTFEDTETIDFPLGDVTKKDRGDRSPSEFAIREIPPEIQKVLEDLTDLKQEMAFQAAFQLAAGEAAALNSRSWNARTADLSHHYARLHRLETETWRRFASGFSCLFFVMVGTPLAIRLRTADVWNSFALCFFPILIVYYPLLAFGLDRAKSGEFPPYIVWVGNLVLGIIGLVLYRKVIRY